MIHSTNKSVTSASTTVNLETKMNVTTLNLHQGTIQDVRFMDDRYVAPVSIVPTTPSLLERTMSGIADFFDRATQTSFEAWERSGKNERF
jgi:hypothetical protein